MVIASCGGASTSDRPDPGSGNSDADTYPSALPDTILLVPPTPTTATALTRPPVTEPPIPQVFYVGGRYECGLETRQGWECSNGISTIYCNDWPGLHSKPRDCSFDWYPSVLINRWIAGFNGSNYICDNTTRTPRGCMAYAGGEPPPSNFQDPDIWCTSGDGDDCSFNGRS